MTAAARILLAVDRERHRGCQASAAEVIDGASGPRQIGLRVQDPAPILVTGHLLAPWGGVNAAPARRGDLWVHPARLLWHLLKTGGGATRAPGKRRAKCFSQGPAHRGRERDRDCVANLMELGGLASGELHPVGEALDASSLPGGERPIEGG